MEFWRVLCAVVVLLATAHANLTPPFEYAYKSLLRDYSNEALDVLVVGKQAEVHHWKSLLPNAKFLAVTGLESCHGAREFDVTVVELDSSAQDVAAVESLLGGASAHAGGACTALPGGLIFLPRLDAESTEWLLSLPAVMNRGFFDAGHRFLKNEGDLHIKAVTVTRPVAGMSSAAGIVAVKSVSDDAEYLTLGDYGKKFGDGETGVVMRALYRQISHRTGDKARANAWMAVHAASIARLQVRFQFKSPRGVPSSSPEIQALTKELSFGLALNLTLTLTLTLIGRISALGLPWPQTESR